MKKIFKTGLLLLVLSLCLTGCGDNEETNELNKEKNKIAAMGAEESSALGYVDAVEKHVMLAQVDTAATKIEYPGTYTVEELDDLGVEVKGEMPKSNGIVIIKRNGAVSKAWLEFDNYKVYYDGSSGKAEAYDKDAEHPGGYDDIALCETQMDGILSAARSYGADKVFDLPTNDGETLTITFQDLVDGDYIDDIINPITEEYIDSNSEIYITKDGKKWTYKLSEDFSCDL